MDGKMHEQLLIRRQRTVLLVLVAVLLHGVAAAQGLTGVLIGTVSKTFAVC